LLGSSTGALADARNWVYIQLMGRKESRTAEARIAAECHSTPLRMVHRVVTAIYDRALRPFDLRIAQGNLLVAISVMGEHATAARLSSYLMIEKSTLSRDLERLQERRWIAVDGEGRTRRLRLTAEGRRLVERTLPAWEEAQAEVEALLGRTTTAALAATAARLRAHPPAVRD
jgi:DNA-binding MarR family transcriptional regulator